MNFLERIIDYLLSENRRLSSKAAVIVFSVLTILLIDNILGFSYSYVVDKKIEQIQKLNALLKDTTLDQKTKYFAESLRSEILVRQNIVSKVRSLLHADYVQYPVYFTKPDTILKNQNFSFVTPIQNSISHSKNSFWFNVSSGGIYFFLSLFMIPLMIITDRKISLFQRLATGITTTISFVLVGFFLIWAFSLIPQISDTTWLWNYLLNSILQLSLFGLLLYKALNKK